MHAASSPDVSEPPSHQCAASHSALLFVPVKGANDAAGNRQRDLVVEALGTLRIPNVSLIDVMVAFHAAAHDAVEACPDLHLAVTPLEACPGEHCLVFQFALLYRSLWSDAVARLGTATAQTVQARRHPCATVPEVHELTQELFALNSCEPCLPGDSLLVAARVCYAAPLPYAARAALVERWCAILAEHGIVTTHADATAFCTRHCPPAPAASAGLRRDALEMACCVWLAEELSSRWPLLLDPLECLRGWLATRGFRPWDVDGCPATQTQAVIEAAVRTGGRLLLVGDLTAVAVPSVLRLLRGKGTRPAHRIVLCHTAPSGLSGVDGCFEGVASPVRCVLSPAGAAHEFLPDVAAVLAPEVLQRHARLRRAEGNARMSAADGLRTLTARLAADAAPEALAETRRLLAHRREAARRLAADADAAEARVEYYFPVALRAWRLFAWGGWATAVRGRAEFREEVAARLRAHRVRPAAVVRSAAAYDAEVAALVAGVASVGGGGSGQLCLTALEAELRGTPKEEGLQAVCAAHSLTASLMGIDGVCTAVVAAAYPLVPKGVSHAEFHALLTHHPVVDVCEQDLAKTCQKHIAVLGAMATLLTPDPGCVAQLRAAAADVGVDAAAAALRVHAERVTRGREVVRRWTGGWAAAVESAAVLCLWAHSAHCPEAFVDRPTLEAYGKELLRLKAEVSALVQRFPADVLEQSPPVLTVLEQVCGDVRARAEALALKVSADVAQGHVYDLEHHVGEAAELTRVCAALHYCEDAFATSVLDEGPLTVVESMLAQHNYELAAEAVPQAAEAVPQAAALTTLPASDEKLRVAKRLNKLLHIDGHAVLTAGGAAGRTDEAALASPQLPALMPASEVGSLSEEERNAVATCELFLNNV